MNDQGQLPSIQRAIAGTIVALVVTGLLVASYGWQIVFYAFGFAGLVYAVYPQRALYETPAEHPNASTEEKALFTEQVSAGARQTFPGAEGASGPFGRCSSLFYQLEPLRLCPGCPVTSRPCTVLISAAWGFTPWHRGPPCLS